MINRQKTLYKYLHDRLEIKDIRCIHQGRETRKGTAILLLIIHLGSRTTYFSWLDTENILISRHIDNVNQCCLWL